MHNSNDPAPAGTTPGSPALYAPPPTAEKASAVDAIYARAAEMTGRSQEALRAMAVDVFASMLLHALNREGHFVWTVMEFAHSLPQPLYVEVDVPRRSPIDPTPQPKGVSTHVVGAPVANSAPAQFPEPSYAALYPNDPPPAAGDARPASAASAANPIRPTAESAEESAPTICAKCGAEILCGGVTILDHAANCPACRGVVSILAPRATPVQTPCPHDTDGDGNCPIHPNGCPTGSTVHAPRTNDSRTAPEAQAVNHG